MTIKFAREKEASAKIMEAMKSGNEADIKAAWQDFHKSVADQVIADFKEVEEKNDAAILMQRGYRQLTSKEKSFYQKFINVLKSANPQQAFTSILGGDNEEDLMPTTILEDVYKELEQEHELLKAINFQFTGYITKWILNDHSVQAAVWGTITDDVVKEITSAFRIIDINQSKLTAFAFIELGMLDLGPTFFDGYIRRVLKEALAWGLETGIISGKGVNEPTGLVRDIHEGVSFSTTDGYPLKSKTAVTSFTPAEYGALCAKLAKTEKGNKRKVSGLTLICNQTDYYTKVMPATTVLTGNGVYVNDLFPVPTKVIVSNAVADGEAILALLGEYNLFAGGQKNGVIDVSDQYKFLEDLRYFKIRQYATGRATDNTVALYLDITNLEPGYITVKNIDGTVSA